MRLRTLALVVGSLGVLSIASPAWAQIAPCDVAAQNPLMVRRDNPLRALWMHQPVDDTGTPIPLGAVQFKLTSSSTGNTLVDFGNLMPVSGPDASGSYCYAPPQTFYITVDISVLVAAVFDGVTALSSTPIVIDVRGGPRPPSGVRIVISQG